MLAKTSVILFFATIITFIGFASSLSTDPSFDVQLSFKVTAEFWKDNIANHGMLLEIHFEEEGEYESIEKISLLGGFGRGKEEIILNAENSRTEFLLWDPTTRALEYFVFLENDYEFETGSTYSLKFLTTNGLKQSYDFVIEDAERDYPNIAIPADGANFATPQDVAVRWSHPLGGKQKDGKIIESYYFLLSRESESGYIRVMDKGLSPVSSNSYEVMIPKTALTDDSKYRVFVDYTAHFEDNPLYFQKVSNWIEFTVGDYQDPIPQEEADPELVSEPVGSNTENVGQQRSSDTPRVSMELLWLEKSSAKCSFTWITEEETITYPFSFYLKSEKGSETLILKTVLKPGREQEVILDKLMKDTKYQIGYRKGDEKKTNWLTWIKTFGDFNNGLQLFYWLDLTNPYTHKVKVKVFGYYKSLPEIYLDNYGYHTEGGLIRAQDIKLTSKPQISMKVQENNKSVRFDLKNNQEGYFRFSYTSDKNAIVTPDQIIEGYFCPDYLIASHEQILYGPGYLLRSSDELKTNPDFFNAYLSLFLPDGWVSSAGWAYEYEGLYSFPYTYIDSFEEFFHCSQIFAYRSDAFTKETKKYGNHLFNVIFPRTIDKRIGEDVLSVYQQLVSLWGRPMDIPSYTVIITDPPDSNASLLSYAGEWTTGQGYSSNYGFGGMVIHQMFHLWNAWAKGIPCTHEENTYFWSEGVNNFYCDKILTELPLKSCSHSPHNFMKSWYNRYKAIRGKSADLPLVSKIEGHFPDALEYWKGAVFAYALDKEIRSRSNGRYSLDDVLKHLLKNYTEKGSPVSYREILNYLRQIIPSGLDDWWQRYMVKNEPLFLKEFE